VHAAHGALAADLANARVVPEVEYQRRHVVPIGAW
jgi:hypothetical protein